jgi:23S rRNA (guanosine2251-2'-O)-methyltransferase
MSFWIYGINAVSSVLEKRPKDIKEIIFLKTKAKNESERIDAITETAKWKGVKTRFVGTEGVPEEFREKEVAHQRVFAVINPPRVYDIADLVGQGEGNKFFIMLDGITDVHNIGAIIRTAVAFGVDAVILPKDKSASITADVYKTSSGAIESIKVCVEVNMVRVTEILKKNGFWIYGFEADGSQEIQKADLKGNVCCVIGGEDSGIRRLLKDNCDMVLRIPMSTNVNSLNASVSAGVVMYEVQRQRLVV